MSKRPLLCLIAIAAVVTVGVASPVRAAGRGAAAEAASADCRERSACRPCPACPAARARAGIASRLVPLASVGPLVAPTGGAPALVVPVQRRDSPDVEEDEDRRERRDLDREGDERRDRAAWLGVEVQELDEALREAFDLDGTGVLVNRVIEDSAADEAGLRTGDVLVRVDGRRLRSVSDLQRRIRSHEPGEDVEITYVRSGREHQAEAVLQARARHTSRRDRHGHDTYRRHDTRRRDAPSKQRRRLHIERLGLGDRAYLGVRLESLDENLAGYFEVEAGGGVLVVKVVENSPAHEAGLRSGDVIVSVDGRRVRSPGKLRDIIQSYDPDDVIVLALVRQGDSTEIDVTLGRHAWPSVGRHAIRLPGSDRWSIDPEGLRERVELFRERLDEAPIRLESRLEDLEEKLEALGEELGRLKDSLSR